MALQKFIDSIDDKSADTIRTLLYKHGIKTSHSMESGLMVAYVDKANRKICDIDELAQHCNGSIIDLHTYKVLAIQQLMCITNIDSKVVNKYLAEGLYTIHKIKEGTQINLFWLERRSEWVISTSRGYDMKFAKWGDITYGNVLSDILDKFGTTSDEFYDTLDKNKSYSFGIKHPSMHPFHEGKGEPLYDMWYMHSTDMINQLPCDDYPNKFGISGPDIYENKVTVVKQLFPLLSNSLNDFITNKKVNYGFLLTSNNVSITGRNSNILLESTLLRKIREMHYINSFDNNARVHNYDRNTFITIYTYLDVSRYSLFRILFPSYNSDFDILDNITNDLYNDIIAYAKNKFSNLKYENYSIKLFNKISNVVVIDPKKNNSRVITTFILSEEWLDMYYKIFESLRRTTSNAM